MKNQLRIIAWMLAGALALAAIDAIAIKKVHAQANATGAFEVSSTLLLAQCPAQVVAPTFTHFCPTGDGNIYTCLSTATNCATAVTNWKCLAGPACPATVPAGVVQTIDGIAPGATGNVTCTDTTPATPVAFSGTSSLTAGIPAMTATSTCKGS